MQILQHDDQRAAGDDGGEVIEEGGAHLVRHALRVAARGPQRQAVLVREGSAHDLAEELLDAPPVAGRHPRLDLCRELPAPRPDRLALVDPARAPQRLAQHAEGRAGPQRVAAHGPHRHPRG
ncbi:hypothetical protein [Sorangium sp. So ce341]|uniref:hypothetical protein n=1 Tax=Sorangium sp. So ce341 TaxID=3133302 RepID=UPI003F5F5730